MAIEAVETVETVLTSTNSDDGAVDNPTAVDTGSDNTGDTDEVGTTDATTGSETSADDSGTTGDNGDQSKVPEAYADFTMPEGVEVDAQLLEQATPVFKELGLTQEQAQKLVDIQAEQVQAGITAQVDAFNQLKNDWQQQAKSDAEIGGEKFEQNVGNARAALEEFGTPELNKLMSEYGIGNHPEMIRVFSKVGALLKEDVPGMGDPTPGTTQDHISILYPS